MSWNVGPALKRAIEQWDRDVEAKAVKFIEQGYDPHAAMRMARDAVESDRRLAKLKGSRRNDGR